MRAATGIAVLLARSTATVIGSLLPSLSASVCKPLLASYSLSARSNQPHCLPHCASTGTSASRVRPSMSPSRG